MSEDSKFLRILKQLWIEIVIAIKMIVKESQSLKSLSQYKAREREVYKSKNDLIIQFTNMLDTATTWSPLIS